MTNKRPRLERKTMPVKGGYAWVEIVKYRKRHPQRWVRMEYDPDGVIRKHRYIHFIKGTQTGDCSECKQMPCPHTAQLFGWKVNTE
jgi:hypothetical protein